MSAFRASVVIVAAALFVLYSSVFIVDEREKALIVRFGEINRTINEPGLYFKLPFVDERIRIEDRIVFFESPNKTVQVVDGRRYQVDAITMLRIVDPTKFRETVDASLNRARDRIETRLDAALRQTYGRRSFDAALTQDRPVMMREIRDQVRSEAIPLGLDIVDVRIRRTDLLPEVLQETYSRMSAERLAEAALLRAIGESQSIKVRAEADRNYVELVSTARRESEIIRGEGDAERNRVFAEAYSKDQEFFSFYRSILNMALFLSSARRLCSKGTRRIGTAASAGLAVTFSIYRADQLPLRFPSTFTLLGQGVAGAFCSLSYF